MKKFLLTVIAAVMVALSADAQVYVGGGFAVQGKDIDYGSSDKTTTIYKFLPEIGYNFNETWAIGVVGGWQGETENKVKTVSFDPYVRATFIHTKYVNVFAEGGFGYTHTYNSGNDDDYWRFGVKPGVSVNLSDHLSFVSRVGFLGWEQTKNNNNDVKTSVYGLDLDGNNISFSLYYNF